MDLLTDGWKNKNVSEKRLSIPALAQGMEAVTLTFVY